MHDNWGICERVMRSRVVFSGAVCAGFDDRFDDMDALVAGPGLEPGAYWLWPIELPLLHPASIHPLLL